MQNLSTGGESNQTHRYDDALEAQIVKLKREVTVLRDMLNADGVAAHDIDTAWAAGLSPSQRQLMAALIRAHPRWVQPWDLEAAVPTSRPGREHWINFARVVISQIRKKLGADVIENLYGVGYRASPAFIERLKKSKAA